MNEQIIETAKKLKALCDRGVSGERDNAIDMLNRYMQKHNITIEMIEGRIVKDHQLFLAISDLKFFKQIASSVLGVKFPFFQYRRKLNAGIDKYRYGVSCTDAEFIEIMARFDFYKKVWEQELEIFYSAFVQTQQIWSKSDNEDTEEKELTPEERQRLFKVANMMQGMERKTFYKQLN